MKCSMTRMLNLSLEYSCRWQVLPLAWITKEVICGCRLRAACTHPGKHPLTKNGVNDATAFLDIIKKWWSRWPLANIVIRTGRESDLGP